MLAVAAALSSQAQTFSVLYSFGTNPQDGASPDRGSLVRDGMGNLYGTTYAGGDFYQGTVFKLDASGTETVLYNFKGLKDGAGPIASVILDGNGNLYGTTSYKGALNGGTLFKLNRAGKFRVLHSFTGGTDGSQPYGGVIGDHRGNLYGTTKSGGHLGFGTVFKRKPTGKFKVLYSFMGSPDGGQPTAALIRDAAGNIYGTTSAEGLFHYGTVFKLDATGKETVLHDFTGSSDGIFPLGGLVRDAAGNLYGATSVGGPLNLGMVFVLDASGRETDFLNFGGANGSYPVGDLIRDAAGNLYGTTAYGGDFGDGMVFSLDATAGFKMLHSFSGGDGYQPYAGLKIDAAGNLYGTTRFGGAFGDGVIFKITP